MASITLTKNAKSGLYELETTVSKDFNIHIETAGTQADRLDVAVTTLTTSTNKQTIYSKYFNGVIDHDFEAKVYPKKITIACTSAPSVAELTIAS